MFRLRNLGLVRPIIRKFIPNPNRIGHEVDEEGNVLKQKLAQEEDFYKILEIPRFATQDEIKRKYRHLAKIHHPDAVGGETELFVKVQEAFATLSDPEKRKNYNNEKREKENIRIKVDDTSEAGLKNMKLSEIMKNLTVSYEIPNTDNYELVIGMRNPAPKPPMFIWACPTIILGNIGIIYAIKSGHFDATFHDWIDFYNRSFSSSTDTRLGRMTLFTGPNMIMAVAASLWFRMHHYFICLLHHLSYPEIMLYSIYHNKKDDKLLLVLADTDKMNMFKPKRMFVEISEASKINLEPALDNVDYGFFGRVKTISFDLPYEHNFGLQKLRTKFFSTFYNEDSIKARQLELVMEQLKANHIQVHIPHFLQINQSEELDIKVPLLKYIALNNFMRVNTNFFNMWGKEQYQSNMQQKTESLS